ncbi:MAG: DUF192 domain-containing protein, partial [Actinomycetota bacterium]
LGTPYGSSLQVEIARTAEARAHGLMGRRRLGADRGMYFECPQPTTDAFCMKDTLVPLSVAFFDDHFTIVGIRNMLPCTVDDCPLYRSPRPYVGAIEANRGYFGRHGIRPGDRVYLQLEHFCQ